MNVKTFAKALVPAIVGILLAAADMAASGHIDLVRLRALAAGVVTAIAVYLIPNATPDQLPPTPTAPTPQWTMTAINTPTTTNSSITGTWQANPTGKRPLTPAERRWGTRQ